MKIVTIVGARPQFIRAFVVSVALAPAYDEIIVHTGQHCDHNMSDAFFEELSIPRPKYNLGVGSGTHGKQTGEMLIYIEEVLLSERPDILLIYGDTNSTLAGALAASKLHIPVAHVETGLRSYNRRIPEEQNRVLTDHISTWLFCPTQTAGDNLKKEGIEAGISITDNVMLDSVLHSLKLTKADPEKTATYEQLCIVPKGYRLTTLHQAGTTDDGLPVVMRIFRAFEQLPEPVVLPTRPRTRSLAEEAISKEGFRNIRLINPVGYLEMLLSTSGAKQVLTDLGRLQKKVWFVEVPCVTLRQETEWVKTPVSNWNILSKLETEDILDKALHTIPDPAARGLMPFGDDAASQKIVVTLLSQSNQGDGGVNIILSNHYAGTGKSMKYRPYFMAKRWARQGHQVTVVLSSFSHLRDDNPGLKGRPYQVEMIDGIRYFWIAGPEYHGNGMGHIRNMLSFIRGLSNLESAITEAGQPDAVVASSTYPLEIYPLRKIVDKHGAKLVYEVHNLWPLSPMGLGGIPRYHPYIMLMQATGNYCYKHCDTIVSILPNTQEHMIQHGMKSEKFACIPNGIVKENWETTEARTPVYAEKPSQYHEEGYLLIGYTGAHGVANTLDSYVEAGELLWDKKIKLLLVDQSPECERLIQKINDLELNGVIEALPAVERDEIPGLLEQLDALYVGLQRQPLFRLGVSPNKLMDYMMAAKSVIFAIEAGNDMVADAKYGISIPPEDPVEIVRAAQILASTPRAELETMGKHGQDYILKHHEHDVLSNRLLEVLVQAK